MAKTVKLADIIPSRFAHLTPANAENIERIREDLVEGSKVILNDPHVFREGPKYELLAGHDRVAAARLAGWTEIQVREFVTLNTDDAILAHFCRENLLRKDVSKAAIAGQWLQQHTDWQDTRIAAQSGCSVEYVGQVRAKMVEAGTIQVVEKRVAEDGSTHTRKPRGPKKGPLASKQDTSTPAKPKYEEKTEDTSSALVAAAAERARLAAAYPKPVEGGKTLPMTIEVPPAVQSEAESSETVPGAEDGGVHQGNGSVPPEARINESVPAGVGGSVPSEGTLVPELGTAAVVGGVSVPEAPALSIKRHVPSAIVVKQLIAGSLADPTDADKAVLTGTDREWFVAVNRWAQKWAAACPSMSTKSEAA